MSGLSGYLHGLLQLRPHCRNSDLTERLSRALDETARMLVTACRDYASRSGSRCPLMCSSDGEEYLGAAYGILGVIQQLLLARPYLKLRWVGADLDSLDRDILSTLEHAGRYIADTLAMSLAEGDGQMEHIPNILPPEGGAGVAPNAQALRSPAP